MHAVTHARRTLGPRNRMRSLRFPAGPRFVCHSQRLRGHDPLNENASETGEPSAQEGRMQRIHAGDVEERLFRTSRSLAAGRPFGSWLRDTWPWPPSSKAGRTTGALSRQLLRLAPKGTRLRGRFGGQPIISNSHVSQLESLAGTDQEAVGHNLYALVRAGGIPGHAVGCFGYFPGG